MIRKKNVSQVIQLMGILLSLVALFFIVKSFWSQRELLLKINIRLMTITVIGGGLAYLIANIILVLAWKMMLNWFGETQLSFPGVLRTYGRSQVLKYIPGNLLSLPGRHVLGIQQGMAHGPLIGAATFEIIGLLTAASLFSIMGILLDRGNNTGYSLLAVSTILLLALLSPLVIKYVLSREIVLKRLPVFRTLNWGGYSRLLGIWLLYLCFFAITGIVLFWAIGVMQGSWDLVPSPVVFSIFAVSWLLGFITPGSPAGVGVREGIMILILSSYLGGPASVLISLIMRIITIAGDVLFYFCGLGAGRKNFMKFRVIE